MGKSHTEFLGETLVQMILLINVEYKWSTAFVCSTRQIQLSIEESNRKSQKYHTLTLQTHKNLPIFWKNIFAVILLIIYYN